MADQGYESSWQQYRILIKNLTLRYSNYSNAFLNYLAIAADYECRFLQKCSSADAASDFLLP